MIKRTYFALVIAAPLALSVACSKPALEETETTAAVPVSVEAAKLDTLQATITVSGTIAPAPGAELLVTAPAPARIAEIPKAEGDPVKAGDLLVRFDIPTLGSDVAAKRAAVNQTNARLDLAKAAITRISGLVAQGVAAKREVEEARREQLDAEAAVAQAQSELEAATSLNGRTVVRAQFAGVVAKRWHNVGDLVEAASSDPVLRVIDPRHLQVVAAVPVADLARVQTGHTAKITGPGEDEGAPAHIIARAAQIDTGSATGDVRLAFDKPTMLPAGTAVEITILAEERKNVLLAPAVAVVRDGDQTFVFVAGSDNKAHRHAVTLGLTTRDTVEIKSGLSAGDQVITKGQDGLPDGAAITIVK